MHFYIRAKGLSQMEHEKTSSVLSFLSTASPVTNDSDVFPGDSFQGGEFLVFNHHVRYMETQKHSFLTT